MKKVRQWYATVRGKLSGIRSQYRKYSQSRKNAKGLRLFDSCDVLPAWRFFRVLETNELRYLLDCSKLPEYFEHLLEPVWDQILAEYDKLNKDKVFENSFKDFQSDLADRNELTIMQACLQLMYAALNLVEVSVIGKMNPDYLLKKYQSVEKSIFKNLNSIGVVVGKEINLESINALKRKIAQTETRMQIDAFQTDGQEKEDRSFIKSVVQISNILGRNIDKDTVTVAEWVYLNKDCREIVNARKGQKHGSGY
jgi:hypothetical protein